MEQLIEHITQTQNISLQQLDYLLNTDDRDLIEKLRKVAQETAQSVYGNKIFIRGLIEFTNYCKNDCYYCGIRKSNRCVDRYRLEKETILACCCQGSRHTASTLSNSLFVLFAILQSDLF